MICENHTNMTNFKLTRVHGETLLCHLEENDFILELNSTIECRTTEDSEAPPCFYKSLTFWCFVIFTYLGTIGFNVGNDLKIT